MNKLLHCNIFMCGVSTALLVVHIHDGNKIGCVLMAGAALVNLLAAYANSGKG